MTARLTRLDPATVDALLELEDHLLSFVVLHLGDHFRFSAVVDAAKTCRAPADCGSGATCSDGLCQATPPTVSALVPATGAVNVSLSMDLWATEEGYSGMEPGLAGL